MIDTAWLIELPTIAEQIGPYYITLDPVTTDFRLELNANIALRFAREEDAFAMLQHIKVHGYFFASTLARLVVAEHMWIGA